MMTTDAKNAKEWTDLQLRFQRWLALPKAERRPKTQRALADDFGIDEATLSDWKHLDGFRDAVTKLSREYVKDDVPEVLATIRRLAKKGSQYHTNVFLAMAGLDKDLENAGKGNGSLILQTFGASLMAVYGDADPDAPDPDGV